MLISIFENITNFYSNKKPFVVYKKPNSNIINGFFMKDDSLVYTKDFTESGFVFAPFNAQENTIIYKKDNAVFLTEKLFIEKENESPFNLSTDNSSRKKHVQLVEKALKEINETGLTKVVLSRKESVAIATFSVLEIYKKLMQRYSNAFVYVWFHPKVGLWFGATPETLLSIKNSTFKTMSLAGTQENKNQAPVVWAAKELEEQHLVTVFIENQLLPIATKLKIDKTETVKAGDLLHLRTKVSGNLAVGFSIKDLLNALHPTPAVCGLPRSQARNFILAEENYKRSFYTGFLGELNLLEFTESTTFSNLYVNLRCMEIENNIASIFVGGGITKDSNAEKEWEETVAKSKIMKRVL